MHGNASYMYIFSNLKSRQKKLPTIKVCKSKVHVFPTMTNNTQQTISNMNYYKHFYLFLCSGYFQSIIGKNGSVHTNLYFTSRCLFSFPYFPSQVNIYYILYVVILLFCKVVFGFVWLYISLLVLQKSNLISF